MKTKVQYVCQNCGAKSPFLAGRCSECGSWNSYTEEVERSMTKELNHRQFEPSSPVTISTVSLKDDHRISCQMKEFDRILGGGIIPGSVTLIGGDPGVGKSTLLLQVSHRMARQGKKVLYVSGEESIKQVRMRADRLNALDDKIMVVSETNVDVVVKHVKDLAPEMVVIDSIQVMFRPDIPSSPGSVSQVRESAATLMYLAKSLGLAVFLIGHVTKEGMIAGPKVLEHIVDTVLYFEGERNDSYRILRAVKNRFGATNEIGVFEMQGKGLAEVENPSQIFLSEKNENVSGSVVVVCIEGTRPILVEIQALVSSSSGFGAPRRTTTGVDPNRVSMLMAVLEKRCGLRILDKDVFVNVAGGIRVDEPAADLGILMALKSSLEDQPTDPRTVFSAEVGLGGELRGVSQMALRLREAAKMGFRSAIIPEINVKGLEGSKDMTAHAFANLRDVFDFIPTMESAAYARKKS